MRRRCAKLLPIISLVAVLVASGLIQKGRASCQLALLQESERWRKQAPRPGPPRLFNLPAAREVKLDNGLTLVMIEDHRAPVVTFQIGIPLKLIPYGNLNDFTYQVTLAAATAELITEGAGARTSEQIAREIETLGGNVSSSMNDDYAEVAASVVAENAERMMEIIGDVLLRPTFPVKEVALYKTNRIENLAVERQDPAFLVSEQFNRIVYGSHPYAITAPTPASVRALSRANIAAFHKSNYTPDGTVVVMAGDFDATKMEAELSAIFGKWKKSAAVIPNSAAAKMPKPTARRVYLIDRPGSEQADFRIGGRAVTRLDANYFPLLVANAVLGAGTGSRLFLNIREQKGYAYDVFSSVSALKQAGTFYGGSQARAEVALAAIKEMLAEFDRMRNEKISAEELQNAKNYLTGLFSLSLSTQGGIADKITQSRLLGLGKNYLEAYRARIEAVTADQVQQAARKYITSDNAVIVVVGDAAKLKKDLSTLGPVEVFNIQGRRTR